MPQRNNALNIQTYADARIIADIVLSMQESGIHVKPTYSDLLKRLLEVVWESWEAKHFEFTEDALEFLGSCGFSTVQLGGDRGKRLKRVLNRETVKAMQEVESGDAPTAAVGGSANPDRLADIKKALEVVEDATKDLE